MSTTHDYQTATVEGTNLNSTHVLVGECGGLSAVLASTYFLDESLHVTTEHGKIMGHRRGLFTVLAESN